MTAEQFRAQFETQVEIAPDLQAALRLRSGQALSVEKVIFGYTVYRLLDRSVLRDGDCFYIHARPAELEEE